MRLTGAVAKGGAATAVHNGAAIAVRNRAAPLCEFDPLLSAFLEHLRLLQHLPVLADEEISLDVLRLMLSSGELKTSLTELGIKRGARFKIEHGLQFLEASRTSREP